MGKVNLGKLFSREVNSWENMIQRCTNPKATCYENYGGRGIKVCARWRSFKNFLFDMGPRPEGMTLDRKDTNGDYAPENCKWSTRKEQQRNRRNSNYGKTCSCGKPVDSLGLCHNCYNRQWSKKKMVKNA